jgi:molecular chaperone DnaJ
MYPFIETIRIEDGQIYNLDYHTERFNKTRAAFWKDSTPLDLREFISPPTLNGIHKCRIVYGKEVEEVSIKIPAGARDGIQLNVRGKGNDAPFGGIPGDLLVVIEEEQDATIKREGDNLHQELYISFAEAALGTSKEINTVGGKVKIKIDAGTQSGKILRLAGKGLPSIDSYGKGDMFVHVNVWTPQKLTPEQKEFFETQMKTGQMQAEPSGKEKSFFDKVRDMFS